MRNRPYPVLKCSRFTGTALCREAPKLRTRCLAVFRMSRVPQLCQIGVPDQAGAVCCSPACGPCGGRGCSRRPGGASLCCRPAILRTQRLCSKPVDVACILNSGYLPAGMNESHRLRFSTSEIDTDQDTEDVPEDVTAIEAARAKVNWQCQLGSTPSRGNFHSCLVRLMSRSISTKGRPLTTEAGSCPAHAAPTGLRTARTSTPESSSFSDSSGRTAGGRATLRAPCSLSCLSTQTQRCSRSSRAPRAMERTSKSCLTPPLLPSPARLSMRATRAASERSPVESLKL